MSLSALVLLAIGYGKTKLVDILSGDCFPKDGGKEFVNHLWEGTKAFSLHCFMLDMVLFWSSQCMGGWPRGFCCSLEGI